MEPVTHLGGRSHEADGRNDTTRFLVPLVIPGQVTDLKNQQVPGDFVFLMTFHSEGMVRQRLKFVEGETRGLFIHVF